MIDVQLAGGGGYRETEIAALHQRPEPQRTRSLDALRTEVRQTLCRDLAVYRRYVCQLNRERREQPEPPEPLSRCSEVHTALSLKYAHLFNGFAHLMMLERLPRQGDLFG